MSGLQLPPPALAVFKAYSASVASGPRAKNDLKEFEKLLLTCEGHDIACLVRLDELWTLLRDSLPQYETTWDIMGLLLNRLSQEPHGRWESQKRSFTTLLGETLAVKGRVARGDKQIERLGSMACILALLCVDASEAHVAEWCPKICMSVKDALERSQAKGSIMEAYSVLSVFIKLLYTSSGSPLATLLATTFVGMEGGVQLLFRVAKKGLVEEELTGAPKIVAEKSLVILAKLNADVAPHAMFVPQQLDATTLGNFLVRCARDCSWVQSQDIAITFLARLVFQQRHIPMEFLDRPEVLDMLRHILGAKSTALKVTGVAFISMCPPDVFYNLAAEFEQAINLLADSPARTLKLVIWEAGRGIWGMDSPVSGPAGHALQNSEFLHHAADSVPGVLPGCLWKLLPADVQQMVASSQGLSLPDGAGSGPKEVPGLHNSGAAGIAYMEAARGHSPPEQDTGIAAGNGVAAGFPAWRPSPTPLAALPLERCPSADQVGLKQEPAGRSVSPAPAAAAAGAGTAAAAAGAGTAAASLQPDKADLNAERRAPAYAFTRRGAQAKAEAALAAEAGPGADAGPHGRYQEAADQAAPRPGGAEGAGGWQPAADAPKLEAELKVVPGEDAARSKPSPGGTKPKPKLRIKKSAAVDTTMQAVLALQQLHGGAGLEDEPMPDAAAAGDMHEGERCQALPAAASASAAAAGGKRRQSALGPSRQTSAGPTGQGAPPAAAGPGEGPEDEVSTGALVSKRQRRVGSYAQLAGEKPRGTQTAGPRSAPATSPAAGPPPPGSPPPGFGADDIQAINQLLDSLYSQRGSLGPRGQTLIKNMAEGAANMSSIVYLRTYRLPAVATEGLDGRLSTLKSRAQLVYSGVMGGESLDLLLPFSELLAAESGIIRRNIEAHAKSAGLTVTNT